MKFKTFLMMYRNIIILVWWIIILVIFKVTTNFVFKNGLSILFILLLVVLPITLYIITTIHKQQLIKKKKRKKIRYIARLNEDIENKQFQKSLIVPLEELVGKTLIAITNLPPRAMMGIESCGMLLSAVNNLKDSEDEELHLLMVDNHIPAGAKLY